MATKKFLWLDRSNPGSFISDDTTGDDFRLHSLGIGTGPSTPEAALSITTEYSVLTGTGNSKGLHLYATSGSSYLDALNSSTGTSELAIRTYNNGTYNYSMLCDANGRVGFGGQLTPQTTLSNINANQLDHASTGAHATGITWAITIDEAGYIASFANENAGSGRNGLLISTEDTSANSKILSVDSGGAGAAAGTSRFLVRSDGFVGLSTSNPAALLDLGTPTDGRSIAWTGGGGSWYGTIGTEYSSGDLAVLAGLKLDNDGSPGGTLRSYTGTIGAAGIQLEPFNGKIRFVTDASGSQTADTAFDFNTNTKMSIISSGWVAMGGSHTPTVPLDLRRGGDGEILGLYAGTVSGYLTFREADSTIRTYFGFGDAGDLLTGALSNSTALRAEDALHLAVGAQATDGITVESGGNVGIRITNPSVDLEVIGRIAATPSGTSTDIGYNGNVVVTKPAASGQYINLIRAVTQTWSIGTVYNTSNFAIGTGQGTDSNFTQPELILNTTGNLGIGTKAVAINANIHSLSTAEQLRLGYDASNYASFTVNSTGDLSVEAVRNIDIDGAAAGDLKLGTGNVGEIYIGRSGFTNLYVNNSATGITGSELETLSGGGGSNASSLHTHMEPDASPTAGVCGGAVGRTGQDTNADTSASSGTGEITLASVDLGEVPVDGGYWRIIAAGSHSSGTGTTGITISFRMASSGSYLGTVNSNVSTDASAKYFYVVSDVIFTSSTSALSSTVSYQLASGGSSTSPTSTQVRASSGGSSIASSDTIELRVAATQGPPSGPQNWTLLHFAVMRIG